MINNLSDCLFLNDGKPIGYGLYSEVFQIQNKLTSQQFALKVVNLKASKRQNDHARMPDDHERN